MVNYCFEDQLHHNYCHHHHHHHCNHFIEKKSKKQKEKEQFKYSLFESIQKFEFYTHHRERQIYLNKLNEYYYSGRKHLIDEKAQIRPRSMSH